MNETDIELRDYWRAKYYFVLSRVQTGPRPVSDVHPFGFEVVGLHDPVMALPVCRFKAAIGAHGPVGVRLEADSPVPPL